MKPLKPLCAALCLLAVHLSAHAYDVPPNPRATFNFNLGWKMFAGDAPGAEDPAFDDRAWKDVTLPRAFNEDFAYKVSIAELPTGITWYRKSFKLPADVASVGGVAKKVFLEFQGVRMAGEFWLNGKNLGLHENGITAVGFDVTDALRPPGEDNVLAVRCDSSWTYRERATNTPFQWNDRNFNANYGGITKNVLLHVSDRLHQTLPLFTTLKSTGVYVHARDIDIPGKKARVTAESQVKNDHPSPRSVAYEVVVADMQGRVVATMNSPAVTVAPGATQTLSASAVLPNLEFWSWGYGYLYNVYTILRVDGKPVDVVTTRTGFRKSEFGNGLFKLNDRVLQVKGYAQRTSNEWPAVGIDVPPWLSDFSNKLMVDSNANTVRWMHITPSKQDVESCDRVGLLQAMPAGDAEADATGRRWEQRVEVMRDAIIYNRNNPSILFYESGNENISEEHMAEMVALRNQYDPHGGRAAGSREMLGSKVAEWGGEMLYINKSAKHPLWATEYSRDEGLRKYWDDFSPPFHKDGDGPLYRNAPAREYNRNQDSHAIENVRRWYDYWEHRPGTGARVSSGGVNIIFSDTNTHSRGAENYRRSGEVDAMRIPKDGFFAHKVMWDGWVDVERPAAHILGHWNYAPNVKKNVYVVSSADAVELLVNGRSLGRGEQSYRFLHTFKDVQWEPGTLRAVGYDAAGKRLCTAEHHTAGDPAAIKLSHWTRPGGMLADGSDLALVQFEIVDAQGRRCPTVMTPVSFAIDGPAEWRGGIAQGPDNYILSKTLPAELGINRALLRSATQAGRITLTASADGLPPATLTLETKPVPATSGITPVLPGNDLSSNLSRGPTPAGPSFTPTRRTLKIAGVRTGSNPDRAANSFDDNEETNWTSDGQLRNAWLEYTLDAPATISQVVLKLGAWRTRSYPLRISVDGKEVFVGATSRSLGYVTLSIPPTQGKSLKIEMIAAPKDNDDFNIVEITGLKETAGTTTDGRGALNVVEAELYEPLTPSRPN